MLIIVNSIEALQYLLTVMYVIVPYNPGDWFRLKEDDGYGTRFFTHHLFLAYAQRTAEPLFPPESGSLAGNHL